MRRNADEIRRFLNQAAGRKDLRWEYGGITWQVTIAHTHGDVVATAVWCDEAGYVGYREELAEEFLRDLRISPPQPLLARFRRSITDLRRRLKRG